MGKVKERWNKIKAFFQEVKSETKKVSWPTKMELVSYTIAVLICVFILAFIIGLEDKFISSIVELLLP